MLFDKKFAGWMIEEPLLSRPCCASLVQPFDLQSLPAYVTALLDSYLAQQRLSKHLV
jgi:hypothetical protein